MKNRPKVKKENMNKDIWFYGGIAFTLVGVLLPFSIVAITKTQWKIDEISKLGTIGDFLGGSTVGLLSLASILFVIHSITIQSRELSLQRQELIHTRKEFEISNSTAKVQQIDNAFFNMLSLNNQIVNSIEYKIPNMNTDALKGRAAIDLLKEKFEENLLFDIFYMERTKSKVLKNNGLIHSNFDIRQKIVQMIEEGYSINQDILDSVYFDFHKDFGNIIGHYMRNNYRIVKYICENVAHDQKEFEKLILKGKSPIIADKKYYFGLLRAQWSSSEFTLILVNALYGENKKFKKLILDHDVLDIKDPNSNENDFLLKKSMKNFYLYKDLIESNRLTK